MLAFIDTFLILLMRLCRLDHVVIRNLDDFVNPYGDYPGNTVSLLVYRRRRSEFNKKGMRSEEGHLKRTTATFIKG